MHTLLD